jgi:hypothetical protein
MTTDRSGTPQQGRRGSELRVEVRQTGNSGTKAADIEALRQSYLKHHEQARQEHETKLTNELGRLERLSKKYEAKAQAAAKEAGLDEAALRAELEQVLKGEDPEAVLQQMESLRNKYGSAWRRAAELLGVDQATAQQELSEAVALPHPRRGHGHGPQSRPGGRR